MTNKKIMFAALAIGLFGAMLSAGLLASITRSPNPASADVQSAGDRIDNATNYVLASCLKTLPAGTTTCDNGVQQIKTNCLTLFKIPPASCSDGRIDSYLQARATYHATHIS